MEAVRNKESYVEQTSLFAQPTENPPLREALDFYKHQHDWSNRLIAGDSALVMNSLLEREGMAGQVQVVYMDPPYGIKYGSNFQPFTNKRNPKDGEDADLTTEPEMIRAFRDTWELGIHSYLTSVRDRVRLAWNLLSDSGSLFMQIGDENLHLLRALLDEVFGAENFVSIITFKKTLPLGSSGLAGVCDYIVWYAKKRSQMKFRPLFEEKPLGSGTGYTWLEMPDGTRRKMTSEERERPERIANGSRPFFLDKLSSSGYTDSCYFPIEIDGKTYQPTAKSWRTNQAGMATLVAKKRLMAPGALPCYVLYHSDFPLQQIHNLWDDTHGAQDLVYVVQTSRKVVQRCLLMATDPGDIVFDPTCGSGTTAVVAGNGGDAGSACDTSRVAIALAKQRLMTATFDYYELASATDGVDGGFVYRTVPHITLKSVANNEPAPQETLYDKPIESRSKVRITGPFTVEAVPAPMVADMNESSNEVTADASVVRSGPTQRHNDWRAELLKTGARGLGGSSIKFSRVEPLVGTRFLHAEAETAEDRPRRVVISFGPEYQPLEQRQVEAAWNEARTLDPRPDIVLFAAFQFDPEAAKDIDEMPAAVTKKTTFLKAQMNPDMLTEDLKKKRASNQSFWLVGRPDVEIALNLDGATKANSGHRSWFRLL